MVALVAKPARAVVIVTNWGYSDAPQFATPALFMDVFLNHENGTVYRCNTGALGTCLIDVPPGTINHCQAYDQANLIVSFPCDIPVGKEALENVSASAKTGTTVETPQPVDTPDVVIHVPWQKRVYRRTGSLSIYRWRRGGLLSVDFINRKMVKLNPFVAAKLTAYFFFGTNADDGGGDGDGDGE